MDCEQDCSLFCLTAMHACYCASGLLRFDTMVKLRFNAPITVMRVMVAMMTMTTTTTMMMMMMMMTTMTTTMMMTIMFF